MQATAQAGVHGQQAQHRASLWRVGPKDVSLVSVPKWSGTPSATPLVEFFETIEATAKIGNWAERDHIQLCALRLTETVRAYYCAMPALRTPTITWPEFKASLLKRFRDVKTGHWASPLYVCYCYLLDDTRPYFPLLCLTEPHCLFH
jgi:hypothetical protein